MAIAGCFGRDDKKSLNASLFLMYEVDFGNQINMKIIKEWWDKYRLGKSE